MRAQSHWSILGQGFYAFLYDVGAGNIRLLEMRGERVLVRIMEDYARGFMEDQCLCAFESNGMALLIGML